MLEPRDDGRWNAVCSGCLKSATVTTEELEEQAWERRPDRQLWCVKCSREKREVQFPTNSRGVRMKRRR